MNRRSFGAAAGRALGGDEADIDGHAAHRRADELPAFESPVFPILLHNAIGRLQEALVLRGQDARAPRAFGICTNWPFPCIINMCLPSRVTIRFSACSYFDGNPLSGDSGFLRV